jgi:hypothetical protein
MIRRQPNRRGMTTVDYIGATAVAMALAVLLLTMASWFGWGAYHVVASLAGLTVM